MEKKIEDSKNFKIQFWLPIILAVIGMVGTISQPILHFAGKWVKLNIEGKIPIELCNKPVAPDFIIFTG